MNQGERKSLISFPADDVRAVEVPLEKMEVRLDDGIITFPNVDDPEEELPTIDGDSIELPDELDDSGAMQAMRSMVMLIDVDCTLENVYSEKIPLQADDHHLEDLPDRNEIKRFKIDPTVDKENIYPKTFQLFLAMFNTRNPPHLSNLKNRGSMKNSEEVTSTDWTTLISRPGFSYEKERLKVKNTGDTNNIEFRIRTIDAGQPEEEYLDDSNNTVKTLSPGETYKFNVSSPNEFLEAQAREASSGNSSTAQAVFVGEN